LWSVHLDFGDCFLVRPWWLLLLHQERNFFQRLCSMISPTTRHRNLQMRFSLTNHQKYGMF
jgi:hypothetical protein